MPRNTQVKRQSAGIIHTKLDTEVPDSGIAVDGRLDVAGSSAIDLKLTAFTASHEAAAFA